MKTAIIGFGKMGRLIKDISLARKHSVITFDPLAEDADHQEISEEYLSDVDVCIDFTIPKAVIPTIEKLCQFKKNIIVGTTGWYDQLDHVSSLVKESGIGLLYASNFSIGVNVFYQIVKNAASIMDKLDNYDVCGLEYHHNQKADSPSGTAQTLSKILLTELSRKDRAVFDIVDRQIAANELHFASVRCGSFPGTHEISFDSAADTISLKHTARNRSGFAQGAVLAAEWLQNKHGIFTINDFIQTLL